MGAICCHGNQSSNPIWPKTQFSQSLTPMVLLMKYDYNPPAGLRGIHVKSVDRQMDGRWLESNPISSP